MLSVEDLSKTSSEAAFTAENVITTSKVLEARLQTCDGIVEACGDFPLPKIPQKVAQSEDTIMSCGNQQELAIMAQKQAGTFALALPESVPQIPDSNTFSTRNAEEACYADDRMIPEVVKKGKRKYKRKQFGFSPLGGDSEKKNVTAEQNEGIGIDGNLEKSHMARERKKSKYLSYPYIDPMDETNAGKDVFNLKTESDKGKIINLTSSELLSKLCTTAQSGSFTMERKHTGLVKSFFTYFRRFAFLKLEDASSQELFDSALHISGEKESSACTDDPEGQTHEDLMENPISGDNTSTDIGFSYPLKSCLYGLVERVSLETVPDASKSTTLDKQRKGKAVSGGDESYQIKGVTVDKKRKGKRVSGVNEANLIKSVTVDKQRKGQTVLRMNEANPVYKVLELNANITTSSTEGSNHTGYVAASANPCTTNNPDLSGISGNRVTFVQLLNDVQAGAPKLLQNIVEENKAGVQSSFISESGQSEANGNLVESASSGKNGAPETQCVPPGFIHQHKEVGEKLKIEESNLSDNKMAVSAPDETGVSSQNMNGIEPLMSKETPIKRRKKKISLEAGNSQNKSAAILLNFTSGFSLPSIETILQAFSGFGIINKSETRFVNDSAAQVVFVQSANAKEAFKSIKTNNPFGPVLGNYLLQPLSALPTDNDKMQLHHSFPEMNGINVLPTPPGMNSKDGESPNLVFIKEKVEMMTSMLEKAGSNLSAEMRAKLESEIKSFTGKVNSMVGSSSSS